MTITAPSAPSKLTTTSTTTNDSTPTISGIAEAGSTVILYNGSVSDNKTITYQVTVEAKTSDHNSYGSGSSYGYKIESSFTPNLSFTPGNTYIFDQSDSTNTNHPLAFYLDSNKATSYKDNVTTIGTPGSDGAYTQIQITTSTPETLYYQCSNHGLMGESFRTNLGNTKADSNGVFSITSSTLSDGSYSLTATATDSANNTSSSSSGILITIDTTAPTITGPSGSEAGASISTVSINENRTDVNTFTSNETVAWSYSSASITNAQNFFKSGEVKDSGSGDIVLTFKTEEENSLLDVGGNSDGTKGFKSVSVYSYDSSQNEFTLIDSSALQTGYDFRGNIYTISRQYWIDEWNGTDSLRFDFKYINDAGTEYLDHYYLELIDGTFTFSDTPTNESLLGSSDLNDASLFTINSSSGALSFSSAPDYESPEDSNNGNNYVVTVRATDTAGNTSDQTLTVIVADNKELDVSNHQVGTSYHLEYIKDYDGNLHANTGSVSDATKTSYKYQGLIDVNADGIKEAIYTNKESGRWVTGSINSSSGEIDYEDHGQGGATRVVGIYIDPLVTSGEVVAGSDHDSQRRFQNDLEIDNLLVKTSNDYDSDGFQEVYWKTADGTAYLRALMHDDGNIQYANYQSESQMTEYLTTNGFSSTVAEIIS